MGMMEIRRRVLEASNGLLPPTYQRVEYIAGTGTQYINSEIECTSDLAVRYAFEISTSVNLALCGGIDTRSPIFRHHGSPYDYGSGSNKYIYSISINESARIPTNIQAPQLNTKYDVYVNPAAGEYAFTGPDYNESGTFEPLASRTTGKSYGILARISHANAVQSRPNRTYYFKFYRGGELIGDFVPCYRKSDNEPGMYDLVTKKFFTNAGTGTIGVGPNV